MIVILDFGSQYNQLIARKIRQLKVYSEIVPFNTPIKTLRAMKPEGIILSGGPANIYAKGAPTLTPQVLELGVPVLGICYGMQAIAVAMGGRVEHSEKREYGHQIIQNTVKDDLWKGLPARHRVWMSHGDKVAKLPAGFKIIAATDACPAAMRHATRPIFGVQFHPEVHHTAHGVEILKNFAINVCKCKADWIMKDFVDRTVQELRDHVGNRRLVCAVSGGVDSTVLAVMLHRAIGKQLVPIFVDNGVLRQNEVATVKQRFEEVGIKIRVINAAKQFLGKLKGVSNPEQKRRIIGREFIKVFFKHLGPDDLLAQGTLYPDVIESVSTKGPSATIKTHHNRVKEVLQLIEQGRVVEPLKELFKDEVREAGKSLGLSKELLWRHPFPGPGLAIRILGEVTPKRLNILRQADAIYVDEMKKSNVYYDVWQGFSVLLPVKAVGVMGDERTYEHVLALRAVESVDGMTADWVKFPYEVLARVSTRIINEVKGINRVVYDISSKPPSTIEWE